MIREIVTREGHGLSMPDLLDGSHVIPKKSSKTPMRGKKEYMVDLQTKKTMRVIIMAQCTGTLGNLIFSNGILLAYLAEMGMASATILQLLALPTLIGFFFLMPAAYWSDRFGMKKLGTLGLLATVLGFALIILAGQFSPMASNILIGAGIAIFGLGFAFFSSNWFALLKPLIPPQIRGRFFGKVRMAFQAVAICFGLAVTVILDKYTGIQVYQAILVVVLLLLIIRIFFYLKIPGTNQSQPTESSFLQACKTIVRIPGYVPFCSYAFLLCLFTRACPWIFGLLEKDVLHFNGSQLVLMGNLLFGGSLAGFYLGGKLIDRYGTKPVFLLCHFSYGLILFLFLFRGFFPWPVIVTVGLLTICFGMVQAASSIGLTTELMALIPQTNKSLSTALNLSLINGGTALSAFICSKTIDLSILNTSWQFFGQTMSEYDSLLLGCGLMIVLLIVTLGLIPSVIKPKAQWVPQGS